MNCPRCKTVVTQQDKYCPSCGLPLEAARTSGGATPKKPAGRSKAYEEASTQLVDVDDFRKYMADEKGKPVTLSGDGPRLLNLANTAVEIRTPAPAALQKSKKPLVRRSRDKNSPNENTMTIPVDEFRKYLAQESRQHSHTGLEQSALVSQDQATIPFNDVAFLLSLTPETGNLIVMSTDERIIIGRGRELFRRKILLTDKRVSKRHCVIQRADTGFVVIDCGSSNGTFVNGAPITSFPLQTGDVIGILPDYRFMFISQVNTTPAQVVDARALREALSTMVPDPSHIKMYVQDAGMDRSTIQSGSAQFMWNEVLDLLLRKEDYQTLKRLLSQLREAGFNSEALNRSYLRLAGTDLEKLRARSEP